MVFDFVIVGGGIVGLATAIALCESNPGSSIALLEKEERWASHQTGRNSGVIHSGIYYKPGSLKARLAREGNAAMVEFCRRHRIDHEVCGKLIVAADHSEIPQLKRLYQRGLENGLAVRELTAEEVQEKEPHVLAVAGIHVPSTGIADYRRVAETMADMLEQRGAALKLRTRVESLHRESHGFTVVTNREPLQARLVINCAGLHSDRVAKLTRLRLNHQIVPFRGEYYKLRPERSHLVKSLIYPVPNPDFPFLGVHFTRMVDGEIHAGPNAVLSLKREGYHKTDINVRDAAETAFFPGFWRLAARNWKEGCGEMARSFSKRLFVRTLQRLVPEVQADDLVAADAGVRAQALLKDGRLVDDFLFIHEKNALHVCNAPSPAATASIVIGQAVAEELRHHTFA